MTTEQQRRLVTGPLTFEVSQEEILAELCWPGPPPGQWLGDVPAHAVESETRFEEMQREAA
jgi:hypothetical protein